MPPDLDAWRERLSGLTFERLRIPAALLLLAVVVFVLFPRGGDVGAPSPTPSPSIVAGEPGGAVIETPTVRPSPTPIPTVAPVSPTSRPTPTPVPGDDDFSAEVLACRSISGSNCNDRLGTLPASAGSMTALVLFTAASAGDTMNAILSGPSGPIDGFPYTLEGGGDGYYYTTFTMRGLPAGDYTITATRNGQPVATTSFRKVGR